MSLEIADAIAHGESAREAAWLMSLLRPDIKKTLTMLDEEWEELLRSLHPERVQQLERELDALVETDPVEALTVAKQLQRYRSRDLSMTLAAILETLATYQSLAGEFGGRKTLFQCVEEAQLQQGLAAAWIDRLSVIEYGETGHESWLLADEFETCRQLRAASARVLAAVDYRSNHPHSDDTLPALMEQATSLVEVIEHWSEDGLTARIEDSLVA